ncbi:DUF6777 domain-containing protein [Actinomycetospora sp. TBRC 11914]|uniref:DUF6777 domain-containing protein n=1 Tax=Actinomycetospora sp. TBRC 11914 TaxID=2729387 RepID=UPI00145F69B1|nr:DUF6777 domain-containing protein [Actinomycetospora sp. TBRC 11914]NMO93709.1 hypothetical protein [Actinomycetospora sp. TBRC 11914]
MTFEPRTVRPPTAPGPVPPPPPVRRPRRPVVGKIVAGAVAVALVAGGAGAWVAFSGAGEAAAVQSTSFAGSDPTTVPFGTDAPQVATVAATGPQAGDTPAMYAATTPPSCDTTAYMAALQADPAKLAAFGGVFGLGPADVPAFVRSLSPVVLRAATSVTDHPFTDGAFVERPAVLAPGTAVLVNSYGEPTVKCYNGNPLTAGATVPNAVTVTPTAMTTFHFTTIAGSGTVDVPTPRDPKPHPGPNPAPNARYNYDGSVLLSDGRIVKADGTVVMPKAPIPAGAVKNPDGSFSLGGKVFNPDGTERTAIVIPPQTIQLPVGGTTTVPGFTIRLDGEAVDASGTPLAPQPTIIRNYDGTATVISGGEVVVWGTDGNFRSKFRVEPPNKVNPDGSITTPDGGILNPDGSTKRTPVTLPGGGTTVQPNGGEAPQGKDHAKDPAQGTATGQTVPVCPKVVTDAASGCGVATGSADSAAKGSGTTGTGTTGTGATGTGATGTGSDNTSTSTSGSDDSSKASGSGSTSGSSSSGSSSSGAKNTSKGGSDY